MRKYKYRWLSVLLSAVLLLTLLPVSALAAETDTEMEESAGIDANMNAGSLTAVSEEMDGMGTGLSGSGLLSGQDAGLLSSDTGDGDGAGSEAGSGSEAGEEAETAGEEAEAAGEEAEAAGEETETAGEEAETAGDGAEQTENPEAVEPEPAPPEPLPDVTLTFDANGGTFDGTEQETGVPNPMTVKAGGTVVLPKNEGLYRDGLHIMGWAADPDADRPEYLPGDSLTVEQNLTLYAVYMASSFQVTYILPDGSRQTEEVDAGEKPVRVPAGVFAWSHDGETGDPAQEAVWADITWEGTAAPALNRDSHAAFMEGDGDYFWPDSSISRGSVALVLYNLLEEKPTSSRTFTDVPADAWCAEAVGALADLGILSGYADGSFHPSDPITRAAFAKIVSRFVPAGEKTYPDVPEEFWAHDVIGAAGAAGLFLGDESVGTDGNFHPNAPMTRAAAAVAFQRLLGHYPDTTAIYQAKDLRIFLDVPLTHWGYYYIMEAVTDHTAEIGENGLEQWTGYTAGTAGRADGYYRIDGWLYRVKDGRFVYSTTLDGFTYDSGGRYTTGNAELDERLSAIIQAQTNDSMTRDGKLRALYNYVRDNYTYLSRPHIAKGTTGWEESYALEFFQKGKGNCYSFAAAYYELVKELGHDCNTVIGIVGSVTRRPHSWVEIRLDGVNYCFDTELEMAYRRKGVYSYDMFKKTYSALPFYYEK